MYLIFNRNDGRFSHNTLDGVVRTIEDGIIQQDTIKAIEKLELGEYTYYGNYVISRSAGGVTLNELKVRSLTGLP